MRPALIAVLLTIVACGSAVADRKTPPPPPYGGVDAGQGVQPAPTFNLQGAQVYNWVPDEGWQGFGFGLNPAFLKPLVYPLVQQCGGTPTSNRTSAEVLAEWSFTTFAPRGMYAGAGYGSWSQEFGGRISRDRVIVRTTVTFYENLTVRNRDEYGDEPPVRYGRLLAGPFTGVGKDSATTSWEVFLNSYGWARGLNLDIGQEDRDPARLQFTALADSFKRLKPATATFPLMPH